MKGLQTDDGKRAYSNWNMQKLRWDLINGHASDICCSSDGGLDIAIAAGDGEKFPCFPSSNQENEAKGLEASQTIRPGEKLRLSSPIFILPPFLLLIYPY